MKSLNLLLILLLLAPSLQADTVEQLTQVPAEVVVRHHPKTGQPYISIVSNREPERNVLAGQKPIRMRPDYRMLDRNVKAKEVPYEGPVSSRTKVYVLAGSLATLGAVSGAAVIAAAPAATGAGAAGGAGVYGAAGTAVAAGSVSTALLKTRPDPKHDDYRLSYETYDIPWDDSEPTGFDLK